MKRENLKSLFFIVMFILVFASMFFFLYGMYMVGAIVFGGTIFLGAATELIPSLNKAVLGEGVRSSGHRSEQASSGSGSTSGGALASIKNTAGQVLAFVVACVLVVIFVAIAREFLEGASERLTMAVLVTGGLAIMTGTIMVYSMLTSPTDDE